MSSLSAGTTTGTALVHTADTTGDLVLKTGSSATTAVTISGSQQLVGIGTSSPTRHLEISGSGIEFLMHDSSQSANTRRFNIYMSGNATNFRALNDAGNGGPEWLNINNSTLNWRATGTGNTTLYPAYFCRAWVNFNGTGTPAIRASGNVSSITDNGTGDYTVNFTTAMPDANYAVNMDSELEAANATHVRMHGVYYNTRLVGSVRVRVGGTATEFGPDSESLMVSVVR